MKEPPLLLAVQRVVGGIEVEHDLLGPRRVRVEEQVDEQPLDRGRVVADFVVARRLASWRVLEAIEGRLAGQGGAVGTTCGELAQGGGQHRVVAQGVVVEQILVAQRQSEHALAHQGGQAVLDLRGRAVIDEAGGEPPDQPDRPVGGAQKQRPGVGGDRPAIKSRHHGAAFDRCKLEPIRATVRRHRGAPLLEPKALS